MSSSEELSKGGLLSPCDFKELGHGVAKPLVMSSSEELNKNGLLSPCDSKSVEHEVATPVINVVSQDELTDEVCSSAKIDRVLGPYEGFVTYPLLQNGIGIVLIDTGAQVS
jgi:hypothetical protein